ncbi:hypothetical protein EPUS_03070 [Endocarpon pusillum Z07020]|uniref:Uncharacterized protein n=1 Tax=Endocarpon pusillum (strain Z07020 / HMAS-L-300199) TaxID=1263415 RepID=U1HV65_ENDPU|nr:uncharacterized protein EPUS_03070 [Endocarpon pusillum Z07020]ERF73229.1 hypothetical protein EPUS_03070 [Endocarpon pusillum Z07020]
MSGRSRPAGVGGSTDRGREHEAGPSAESATDLTAESVAGSTAGSTKEEVDLIHLVASNQANIDQQKLFKYKVENDMAFHAAVLHQMKEYEEKGASRKRRYLNTALDKCDRAKRRATDPRKSRAEFEKLRDEFDRLSTRPQLMRNQLEKDRIDAYRIGLIGQVASNTGTAEQMKSFEKLLRETEFHELARKQLEELVEHQAIEKADRLYLALARVLVEQKPLPPQGPVLLRGDVPGAGRSSTSQSPSPEEVERDRSWHSVATGTATSNEIRAFRHNLLTSSEFVEAVFLARETCASRAPSEFEVNLMLRLDQQKQAAGELIDAIQMEAVSKVGGNPDIRQAVSPEEITSGRRDRDPTGPSRGGSLIQARELLAHALPPGWAMTFIEMIANRRSSVEMERLFHHKFRTERNFQQLVLAYDKRYRSTTLTAGYEKAVALRVVGTMGSTELLDLFGDNGSDRRRLVLLEQLLRVRPPRSRNIITVTMPPRPDGSPWIVRGGQRPDAPLPQTMTAASASGRGPASGARGNRPGKSTNKPQRR